MRTYQILVNGKPRRVEIAKIGDKAFTVKLEEKTFNAEFSGDQLEFGKSFPIKVNDKIYAIMLEEVSRAKPFTVKVEEASFKVELKAPEWKPVLTVMEQPRLVPTLKGAKPKQTISGTVTAPMTGKILTIKVKKGEQVKAGQVLCILEAMKMENEITAPTAGTIREVLVYEGASVKEGDPLFVIG